MGNVQVKKIVDAAIQWLVNVLKSVLVQNALMTANAQLSNKDAVEINADAAKKTHVPVQTVYVEEATIHANVQEKMSVDVVRKPYANVGLSADVVYVHQFVTATLNAESLHNKF